ncbi:unnamed protein product [Ostreobium quekettii]|uniref:Peptidase S1 domain-containing protein n=1 Tax=Ostreobium quekettii TaxID=121088 RepID=A0A8S1JHD4_9CHLO|nr:unnamed protein product [Ostreobium quekettii]
MQAARLAVLTWAVFEAAASSLASREAAGDALAGGGARRLRQEGEFVCPVAEADAGVEAKIVGGVDSCPEEFPYFVSLRNFGTHFCGGVLIGPDLVLTAAHCVVNAAGTKRTPDVSVGLLDIDDRPGDRPTVEEFKTCRSIIHAKFDPTALQLGYDIALLELSGQSGATALARLDPDLELEEGFNVTAAGFGKISNNQVASRFQKTERLSVMTLEECGAIFGLDFPDTLLCAIDRVNGSDVCQGDSGGPLLTRDRETIVGVVTFGPRDCQAVEVPSAYTRVSAYMDWIEARGGDEAEFVVNDKCGEGDGGAGDAGVTVLQIVDAVKGGDIDGAAELIARAVEEEDNVDVVVDAMEVLVEEGLGTQAGDAIVLAIREKGASAVKLVPALNVVNG